MNFLGGWLRIGRVFTNATNIGSYSGDSIISTKFSDLRKAESQNFLLDGNKFSDLKSLIGFNEYRVFCTKPYHNRTNHAIFSNTNQNSLPLFNYATDKSFSRPSNLCNALVFMPDDNSRIRSRPCNSLFSYTTDIYNRLYQFIYYVPHHFHISSWSKPRLECDDKHGVSGYSLYGTWFYYVR